MWMILIGAVLLLALLAVGIALLLSGGSPHRPEGTPAPPAFDPGRKAHPGGRSPPP